MDFPDIRWDIIWNYKELFIRGIWITLALTIVGYLGGIVLGLFLGMGKLSKKKWIYYPSKYYVDFFRGTPLLVQILLIHLAIIPAIFGHSLGYFVSGCVALILNSAAYNAEIIRAGIQSIEKGQMEAARSLGMPNNMAMRHIILPQALRRMIPPLGNELIALLKDSSLVTVIAANDLLYAGKVVAGAYSRFWEPYITVAILYLFLTFFFGKIITYVENRFSNSFVPKQKKGMFSIRR
ncbi:amino acid ABC transporter permease [Paenisporosarcina sp. OV554]|uniref:amino acid ABC transporter permease n=1 Tax=Paenisporosarcina sp. OV554 TaxID=2135694 RepID=UPI000D396EFE|nr:amino acid ABC transporter permease [Paenisporosarcina sp. OV554]PUB14004.1 amino acid ABC transporter membrane protein (PAAT family) [Paenisporosarcina sp. OV554]